MDEGYLLMGRIADALKRAEQERRAATGQGLIVEAPPFNRAPRTNVPTAVLDSPAAPEEPDDETNTAPIPGMSEAIIPYYEPSSLISEQYRSLRTRLLSQNPNYEHRILAITSGAPKDGKSVTTINLGCTLAEIRHLKVLVVDGDFRRSTLGRMLNMPDSPGLAEVFRGEARYEEVVRRTPIPNLFFIPAGSMKNRSAAELFTTKAARQTFARMRNEFHYTIVDTPPATTVSDAGIVGQMCNGVIVLVRMNRTHEALAKRAVRLLQTNNVPILGCLAIGRETATGGFGYGYGYYYNRYYYDYHRKNSSNR